MGRRNSEDYDYANVRSVFMQSYVNATTKKINLVTIRILSYYRQKTSIITVGNRRSKLNNGGGGLIFIYSCSQIIKTIDINKN